MKNVNKLILENKIAHFRLALADISHVLIEIENCEDEFITSVWARCALSRAQSALANSYEEKK
jgi:hypothetical protein